MTTLTVEFPAGLSHLIDRMLAKGFYKTKAEAVRASVLVNATQLDLVQELVDRRKKLVADAIYADFKEGVNRSNVSG